jgi:hypothetical protein
VKDLELIFVTRQNQNSMDPSKSIIDWILGFDLNNYSIDLKPTLQPYLYFPPLTPERIIQDRMTNSNRCYDKNGYLVYEGFVRDNQREGQGVEYA